MRLIIKNIVMLYINIVMLLLKYCYVIIIYLFIIFLDHLLLLHYIHRQKDSNFQLIHIFFNSFALSFVTAKHLSQIQRTSGIINIILIMFYIKFFFYMRLIIKILLCYILICYCLNIVMLFIVVVLLHHFLHHFLLHHFLLLLLLQSYLYMYK